MSDSTEATSSPAGESAQPVAASTAPSPSPQPSAQASAAGAAGEHPELIIGAAFAGGLLLATILKRLAN